MEELVKIKLIYTWHRCRKQEDKEKYKRTKTQTWNNKCKAIDIYTAGEKCTESWKFTTRKWKKISNAKTKPGRIYTKY